MKSKGLLHHKRGRLPGSWTDCVLVPKCMAHLMGHHVLAIGLQGKSASRSSVQPPIRIEPDPISSENRTGESIILTSLLPNGLWAAQSNRLPSWSDLEGVAQRGPSLRIRKVNGYLPGKAVRCVGDTGIDPGRVPDNRHPCVKRKECFIPQGEKPWLALSAFFRPCCAPSARRAASIVIPSTSIWPAGFFPSRLPVSLLVERPAPVPLQAKTNLVQSPLDLAQRMKCTHCKKRASVSFPCKWCTHAYCTVCRLPECHACPSRKQEQVVLPAPVTAPKVQAI
jgi:hypothetical protein